MFLDSLKKCIKEKTVKQKRKLFRQRIEAAHQRCSMKKDVLKNFTELTGRPATLLKRDSGAVVFLRILQTF